MKALPADNPIKYVQKIDSVLFSHAGVQKNFAEKYAAGYSLNNVDGVVERINSLGQEEMWYEDSPIWVRPQIDRAKMYRPQKLLQVVGHAPMKKITKKGNLISCDVFSTRRDGGPIGTEEFLLLDTETWDFTGVKG